MSHHQRIEEFNLTREPWEPFSEQAYEFIIPFVGPDCEWATYQIVDPLNTVLHTYSVSVKQRAYIVRNAVLCSKDPPYLRRTDMRLHQMIIANYIAAGGDPKVLQYIGIHHIINGDAKLSIWNEFKRQGRSLSAGEVIVRPKSPAWSDCLVKNAFAKCGNHVVRELCTITGMKLSIRRLFMISIGSTDFEDALVNMVIEIGDKEDDEEVVFTGRGGKTKVSIDDEIDNVVFKGRG